MDIRPWIGLNEALISSKSTIFAEMSFVLGKEAQRGPYRYELHYYKAERSSEMLRLRLVEMGI